MNGTEGGPEHKSKHECCGHGHRHKHGHRCGCGRRHGKGMFGFGMRFLRRMQRWSHSEGDFRPSKETRVKTLEAMKSHFGDMIRHIDKQIEELQKAKE